MRFSDFGLNLEYEKRVQPDTLHPLYMWIESILPLIDPYSFFNYLVVSFSLYFLCVRTYQ